MNRQPVKLLADNGLMSFEVSTQQSELEYYVADVFTETALAGNPVAVVFDTVGLAAEKMQAIAREFNLSETTFVQRRPADAEQTEGVRVRIFTTQEELPFAGHPTLGTAATIRALFPEFHGAEKIVLDLNAGQVPVVFPAKENTGGAAFGRMTQPQPVFGRRHEPSEVAPLLGLRA